MDQRIEDPDRTDPIDAFISEKFRNEHAETTEGMWGKVSIGIKRQSRARAIYRMAAVFSGIVVLSAGFYLLSRPSGVSNIAEGLQPARDSTLLQPQEPTSDAAEEDPAGEVVPGEDAGVRIQPTAADLARKPKPKDMSTVAGVSDTSGKPVITALGVSAPATAPAESVTLETGNAAPASGRLVSYYLPTPEEVRISVVPNIQSTDPTPAGSGLQRAIEYALDVKSGEIQPDILRNLRQTFRQAYRRQIRPLTD